MIPMQKYAVERWFDWEKFALCHWEKHPVLYEGVSAALFDVHDVFRAAAEAARTLPEDPSPPGAPSIMVFTIERRQQMSQHAWAPHATDGSFEGYHARLAHALRASSAAKYALIVNSLHSFSFPLWSQERTFFEGLWRRVGLPLTGAGTTLFHGNYEHTPVGVHKDRSSTFLFGIAGRKRMRFWQKKPWTEPVTTVPDYEPYISASFAVEVKAGDLLYWPSSYYHVGESLGGEPATSVNVGIPRTEHRSIYELSALLLDFDDAAASLDIEAGMMSLLPRGRLSALAKGARESGGTLSSDLPEALNRVMRTFRTLTEKRTLDRRLRTVTLEHLSAGGFMPVPRPAPRIRLDDENRVVRRAEEPILWAPEDSRSCICASHGHSARVMAPAVEVRRVVEALNSGQPTRVGDLGMRFLLEKFLRFRAITQLQRARLS